MMICLIIWMMGMMAKTAMIKNRMSIMKIMMMIVYSGPHVPMPQCPHVPAPLSTKCQTRKVWEWLMKCGSCARAPMSPCPHAPMSPCPWGEGVRMVDPMPPCPHAPKSLCQTLKVWGASKCLMFKWSGIPCQVNLKSSKWSLMFKWSRSQCPSDVRVSTTLCYTPLGPWIDSTVGRNANCKLIERNPVAVLCKALDLWIHTVIQRSVKILGVVRVRFLGWVVRRLFGDCFNKHHREIARWLICESRAALPLFSKPFVRHHFAQLATLLQRWLFWCLTVVGCSCFSSLLLLLPWLSLSMSSSLSL